MELVEQAAESSGSIAAEGRRVGAYDAAAFRYLLDVERTRAARSGRSLVVLLVRLGTSTPGRISLAPATAAILFDGLSASIREVDFVGWFRERRIAGAVLTQKSAAPSWDACREIEARAHDAIAAQLPADLARRLQVRVLRLGRKRNSQEPQQLERRGVGTCLHQTAKI